ncbi:hypothetical protein CANMA_002589 [Candida margitis]|uniref:uncharacterized protein n=1 Tax=Candida margitis TaxID=1775924 RepID=UPI00222782BD|nr:uncharacterized protein CANMA_002589 [Candida margitis]KAI5968087.1 hypothetical protein CANMA_002589 [Candida margitis]
MKNISVQSFKSVLQQCFGSKSIPKKIAIGLSGGPDSMLLVWLLSKYKSYMQDDTVELHAITIDHNYRPESTIEAEQISQVMQRWNVKHTIKKLNYNVDPKTIANFEEVARTKRYEAIRSICNTLGISIVVLGHHCDDQVETFVQRLQGNSSIFGLACTRQVSNIPLTEDLDPSQLSTFSPVRLVRPLLAFEKKTILSTCKLNGIPYVVDPTNNDTKLTRRNYLRNLFGRLLPQMMVDFGSQEGKSCSGVAEVASTCFPYKSITKDELAKSQQECARLAQQFESKAYRLYRQLLRQHKFSESPEFGSLQMKLPKKCLIGYNKIITSKFLYQRLYPYSTLNHYHWAYAKLERGLLPKLESFLLSSRSAVVRYSIMNLIFEVTNNDSASEVEISITRAPLTRTELKISSFEVAINQYWSQWYLYDKRFWLRFKSLEETDSVITIGPYLHKIHSSIVSKSLKANSVVNIDKTLDTLPAIFQNGRIVAFPTLHIADTAIKTEWALKSNKYDFVDLTIS